MSIKLAYLESFALVAELGSISEAAKRVELSQPALSRQVKLLEESLGQELFTRDHTGVHLTDAGKRFQQALSPLLRPLQGLLEESAAERIDGEITLGTLEGIGHSTIMGMILAFRRLHPTVGFHVEFLKEDEIVERLRAGRLDFGVLTRPEVAESCECEPLFAERSVLVTREANKSPLETPRDLERAAFVAYRRDDPLLLRFLTEHFAAAAASIVLTVNSHRAMVEALAAADTYAVMPWRSVERAVEARLLRVASAKELAGGLYLAHPKGKAQRRRHRAFAEHALALARA